MCGEVKSKEKDKTASTPLVTVSDLQKLKLFQAIIIRWRKNPFKTDLAPDFKIDWGIERSDAILPTREKRKIELFDVKKFVSEKKKEEAMNNPNMMGMGMDSPYMGGGFNPFMQSNPFINNRPMNNEITSKDIDDMVKEIEKKLQALDEEEKKENSKKENDNPIITPIKEKQSNINIDDVIKTLEEKQSNEKSDDPNDLTQEIKMDDAINTKLNVDKDSKIINDTISNDDEYFDDFFE